MKKFILILFILGITLNSYADEQITQSAVVSIAEEDGTPTAYPWQVKVTNGTLTDNGDGTASLTTGGGGGGGAPTDATYITQTANGTLSAEQALSTLSTGLMQVTTTTGAITSVTTSAGVSGLLSDETGTGTAVFNNSPTFADDIQLGLAGVSGQLKLYSEQGVTDYTATFNPNSAMTSAANFYLPADEPAGTYLLNMTIGGVMGFDSSTYLTAEVDTLDTVCDRGSTTDNDITIEKTGTATSGTPQYPSHDLSFKSSAWNIDSVTELDYMEYASNGAAQAAWVTSVSGSYSSDQLTGGTPTAKSFYGGYPPENFCDNIEGTFWNVGSYTANDWLKYDFGEGVTKTIQKLTIRNNGSGGVNAFDFQGSNNNSDWDTLASGNATNDEAITPFTFSNSTAYRYYRVYFNSVYNTDTAVKELEMMEFTAPSLQCYSEGTIVNQDTYSLKGVASTSALNATLTKTIGSPIDLTDRTNLSLDIYSSRTGTNLSIAIHDTGGTTSTYNIGTTSANTWETKSLDISGISNANKDAIDSIVIKVTNADSANTFYIDNVYASTGADEETETMTFRNVATGNSSTPTYKMSLLDKNGTEIAYIDNLGNEQIDGDLEITGDDLKMATNTSGAVLVADGTNYNPVVMSGDASIGTNGAVAVADDSHAHAASTISGLGVADFANGTDGNLITWDAAGVPALVATGDSGQVLTSNGAGTAPTFQAGTGGGANTALSNLASTQINTDLVFQNIADGIVLKQGSNGKCGTFVCNGVTAVTVNNTSIAITDTIVFSLNTVGGTVGAYPIIQTITAATGFTVSGTALDTSTYNYIIISNAS